MGGVRDAWPARVGLAEAAHEGAAAFRVCVISASEERLHARRRAARRSSAFEAARRREVAQVGLVGQAVGEVIEVDGGEEVVGAAGLGAVVRGQGLLLVLLVVVPTLLSKPLLPSA